jgi:hypothetical protein
MIIPNEDIFEECPVFTYRHMEQAGTFESSCQLTIDCSDAMIPTYKVNGSVP